MLTKVRVRFSVGKLKRFLYLNQINVVLLVIIGLLLSACLLQAKVKLGSELD